MSTSTYMQTCDVLGTTVELRIGAEDGAPVDSWFKELWDAVFAFDERLSRFKETSELSHFNARAGERVSISLEFKKILEKTRDFAEHTKGIFNPFVLPSLHRAGYRASMTENSSLSPDYGKRTIVSIDNLVIGDDWASIPENTAIDLGGIGKGYLADQLADMLNQHTTSYCLSLGGDMHVSGTDGDHPWSIEIESGDPAIPTIGTYETTLSTYGIATSGVLRKKLGKTQQHLIDPRTGAHAESPFRMCTVVAGDTVSADVYASCILIEGTGEMERLMHENRISLVLLQEETGLPPRVWGTGFTFHGT